MANEPTSPDVTNVESLCRDFRGLFQSLREEVGKVIVGHLDIVDSVLIALFAGGHVLLEGVPGLGKTLLVRTLASALSLEFRRIQFTPDLMPADIIGTNVVMEDQATGRRMFEFQKGPIFGQIILADEINRATPKTQSAMLEAMQEHSVTSAGTLWRLPEPFLVLATQNPIEQEGTYPLPEAQLDRFMFNLWVDYPNEADLKEIIKTTTAGGVATPEPVLDGPAVLELRRAVRMIPISEHVLDYIVRLVTATHTNRQQAPEVTRKYLDWGCGPRAGQYLSLGAKSRALLRGSLQATAEDVRFVAQSVMRHRIVTNFTAVADGVDAAEIVDRLVKEVPE
jgi:MoxR-like ATPase